MVNADTCGGGLVVVDVGIILTLSILSRKSTIDEEVLGPEWMEWMSKGVSTSATKEGEELSSDSLSTWSVMEGGSECLNEQSHGHLLTFGDG